MKPRLPCPEAAYPEIDWKVCTLCLEPWPRTDAFFPRVSARRGKGFHCWCKACFQERRREADARRKQTVEKLPRGGAEPKE